LRQFLSLAALCCVVASSPALAQEPARPSEVSDAEKLEKSAENLERMRFALRKVLAKVEAARNEKDVVKLNCVNEKLAQVKDLIKVAEQADIALHEALANKSPGADLEFTKIGITRSKVDGLKGAADACIGQLAYMVDQKTTVEVQSPGDLPGHETAEDSGRRGRGKHAPPPGPPCRRPKPVSPFTN
jgi:hypothetical protein